MNLSLISHPRTSASACTDCIRISVSALRPNSYTRVDRKAAIELMAQASTIPAATWA